METFASLVRLDILLTAVMMDVMNAKKVNIAKKECGHAKTVRKENTRKQEENLLVSRAQVSTIPVFRSGSIETDSIF